MDTPNCFCLQRQELNSTGAALSFLNLEDWPVPTQKDSISSSTSLLTKNKPFPVRGEFQSQLDLCT